jgi:hypothetical protein
MVLSHPFTVNSGSANFTADLRVRVQMDVDNVEPKLVAGSGGAYLNIVEFNTALSSEGTSCDAVETWDINVGVYKQPGSGRELAFAPTESTTFYAAEHTPGCSGISLPTTSFEPTITLTLPTVSASTSEEESVETSATETLALLAKRVFMRPAFRNTTTSVYTVTSCLASAINCPNSYTHEYVVTATLDRNPVTTHGPIGTGTGTGSRPFMTMRTTHADDPIITIPAGYELTKLVLPITATFTAPAVGETGVPTNDLAESGTGELGPIIVTIGEPTETDPVEPIPEPSAVPGPGREEPDEPASPPRTTESPDEPTHRPWKPTGTKSWGWGPGTGRPHPTGWGTGTAGLPCGTGTGRPRWHHRKQPHEQPGEEEQQQQHKHKHHPHLQAQARDPSPVAARSTGAATSTFGSTTFGTMAFVAVFAGLVMA